MQVPCAQRDRVNLVAFCTTVGLETVVDETVYAKQVRVVVVRVEGSGSGSGASA